jgi:hypothetical protein
MGVEASPRTVPGWVAVEGLEVAALVQMGGLQVDLADLTFAFPSAMVGAADGSALGAPTTAPSPPIEGARIIPLRLIAPLWLSQTGPTPGQRCGRRM